MLLFDYNLVKCSCCYDYSSWQEKHSEKASTLQSIAKQSYYYKVCEEEFVLGGVRYSHTIRALPGSTKGECKQIASTGGPHPYVCDSCNALVHGKSSQLLRKYSRMDILKYPRGVQRAGKCGVRMKYLAREELKERVRIDKIERKTDKMKIKNLEIEQQRSLQAAWRDNETLRPFIEKMTSLFINCDVSEFDCSFLNNWLSKKHKGRFHHADEQARNLAILLSNRLGEKLYSTLAPMMGLPSHRQAQKIRSKDIGTNVYLPGLNNWAFDMMSLQAATPIQISMDGTRIVRIIELYKDKYLVGESFSPDVRKWPEPKNLPGIDEWDSIHSYISTVRSRGNLAAEAYSVTAVDMLGISSDVFLGSIPEATSGVTSGHIYSLIMKIEEKASMLNLSVLGYCSDSASNSLGALEKLALPNCYMTALHVKYLALPLQGFIYGAPILRKGYPSIAYPCWDHCSRTSVRNLLNSNISIVADNFSCASGIRTAKIASVHDIRILKQVLPNASVKHADISPLINQNCDAAGRVLNAKLIEELAKHVPGSEATQLYLQASVWVHVPYRNNKFGPPAEMARSLWAGLLTFRRWRQYIILSPKLKLKDHFISRAHYITIELMVHAAILHFLALFLCFPEKNFDEYFLRNTGNRNIEALHGTFRGGTSSLPITTPNYSFREFLEKMNQNLQINKAEHTLKKIPGNSIVSSKKKRKTFARDANEPNESSPVEDDRRAMTYEAFVKKLIDACNQGDDDSQKIIEKLVPGMADLLKKKKKWLSCNINAESICNSIEVVKSQKDLENLPIISFEEIIKNELGPISQNEECQVASQSDEDNIMTNQAYANLLLDVSASDTEPQYMTSYVRGLQPQREKPSKDRSRRFAAGNLRGNEGTTSIDDDNELKEFDFWIIFPNATYRNAKIFLLGQIVIIMKGGNAVRCASHNADTVVVMKMYSFDVNKQVYHPEGYSSILKATVLQQQVEVEHQSSGVVKVTSIPQGFKHYHDDLAIATPSAEEDSRDEDNDSEEYIVEEIVKKRYNDKEMRYEYYVKWQGYSHAYNTWELESNVPDQCLQVYDKKHCAYGASATPSARVGLRDPTKRKRNYNNDYIFEQ